MILCQRLAFPRCGGGDLGRFGGKYRILSCFLRGGTPGPQNFAMTFLTASHTSLNISRLGVDLTFLGSLMNFQKKIIKTGKH